MKRSRNNFFFSCCCLIDDACNDLETFAFQKGLLLRVSFFLVKVYDMIFHSLQSDDSKTC